MPQEKTSFIKKLSYNPLLSRLIWFFGVAAFARNVYYFLNKPKKGEIEVNLGGQKALFFINSPWELRALESSGDFGREKQILELMVQKVNQGEVVYDVGANLGIFTILLAKKVGTTGKVIAFEPGSESYANIQKNIALNKLGNVEVVNMALGDYDGESKLFLGQVTGASSLAAAPDGSTHTELVKVRKGDTVFAENKLPLANVVKIDVEGYEYAVMKGMEAILSSPSCRLVCCEVHPQMLPLGVTSQMLLDFLKGLGFAKIDTYDRKTSEFHIIAYK